MQSPQISVLMPTWNGAEFLAAAVESILAQTLTDFEFLIVDGGSTDQTLDILARYNDPRIRVLQAPGPGIVSALNFGIEQARAPWIARQDADDISHTRRLETQWRAVHKVADAVFSHTNVELIGPGARSARGAHFPRTQALVALRLCFQCGIVHSSVMFRRETTLGVGGYTGQQAEDFGLWGRLIEQGRFVGLPQKLLKFRLHGVSASKRHADTMAAAAKAIALDHCRRFMALPADEAMRAHEILSAVGQAGWKDWRWFLRHCAPRLRWKSAEVCAWLALQTWKILA